jgi:Stage II sporulation protein
MIVVLTALALPRAFAQLAAPSHSVRISVLGLFRPQQLLLTPSSGTALMIHCNQRSFALERSSGVNRGRIRAESNSMTIEIGHEIDETSYLTATGREDGPADFVLAIPGKIARRYHGILEIKPASARLSAVVTMDIETAVASVVAAESVPGTAFEALKAQAVAARSYFIAGKGSHREFDFCDTTHCQYLREPPSPETPAAKAAAASRGLVLAYQSQSFAAMYTRSCSGRTRSLVELRLPAATYPYYSVDCKYCREHPNHWQSRIPAAEGVTLRGSDESARLRTARRLGWSVIPSSDFTIKKQGDEMLLQGFGQGHGLGLCQAGANAMAQSGAGFRQILAHYYPNTQLIDIR